MLKYLVFHVSALLLQCSSMMTSGPSLLCQQLANYQPVAVFSPGDGPMKQDFLAAGIPVHILNPNDAEYVTEMKVSRQRCDTDTAQMMKQLCLHLCSAI